jgi:undecaprenyl-diphosphatase
MTLFQAAVYGLVQGLAEFLPISSSAHLVLVPWFFGWTDPGLTFDVALHVGTLVAVVAYFWRDWWRLIVRGSTPR